VTFSGLGHKRRRCQNGRAKKENGNLRDVWGTIIPLNAELNPICHLLALFGAHHILHVSRIRVKIEIEKYR